MREGPSGPPHVRAVYACRRPCLEEVLQHSFCAEALAEATRAEEARGALLQDAASHDKLLAALDEHDDDLDDLPSIGGVPAPGTKGLR